MKTTTICRFVGLEVGVADGSPFHELVERRGTQIRSHHIRGLPKTWRLWSITVLLHLFGWQETDAKGVEPILRKPVRPYHKKRRWTTETTSDELDLSQKEN